MRKRFFSLGLTLLLLCSTMPMMANWWPSDPYCTFINRIKVDKVWKFNHTINGKPDWTPNILKEDAEMVDCPGYIAFQIMTWDNRKDNPDDYELDWFELSLTDGHTVHKIVRMDVIPESNDGERWEDNWRSDGNINLNTADPQLYINYNGNESRFCHKYLFPDWADGIQYAYIIVKYSEATRKFIEDAGEDLRVRLDGRYDDKNWCDFSNHNTKWSTLDKKFLTAPGAVNLTNIGYQEVNGKTCLVMDVPGVEADATKIEITVKDGNNKTILTKIVTSKSPSHEALPLDFLNKDSVALNNGVYTVHAQQHHDYILNRTGYEKDHGLALLPDTVRHSGPEEVHQLPQIRIAKNLHLQQNLDGTVSVSWNADEPAPGREYDQSQWLILRSTDEKFNSDKVEKFYVSYDGRKKSYSEITPFTLRNQGKVTYYYRVCRESEITQQKPYYASGYISVNTDYAGLGGVTLTSDGQNMHLKWNLIPGVWTSDSRLELYKNDNADQLLPHPEQYDTTGGEYVFKNMSFCDPTVYHLKVKEKDDVHSQSRDTFMLPGSLPSKITSFRQSKGYYGNRVELRWTIDKQQQNFHHFVIKRKMYGASDNTYQTIESSIAKINNVLDYSYVDKNVIAGTYYVYKLEGVAECANTSSMVGTEMGIGFSQPYGIVTGQVLFENGQAVKDVCIDMTGESDNRGAALDMQGNGYAYLDATQAASLLSPDGGGVEMQVYVPNLPTTYMPLAFQDGALNFGFSDATHLKVEIIRSGKTYTLTAPLNDSVRWQATEYNHVAMSYRNVDRKLIVQIVVNGRLAARDSIANVSGKEGIGYVKSPFYIGYNTQKKVGYKGYMDDLRLWNTYRTPAQIAKDYDCYLSGRESGLVGYYHCDVILENHLYDLSGDGVTYHENHLQTVNTTCNPNYLPSSSQLALRSRTDDRGNYLINAVPYNKLGSLYTMKPSLGMHQFSPATKTLFFDENASTHNNIDFTDISSFTVSGTVTYAGGTYPVQGVQFKVDGTLQLSRKGGAVVSDEEGHFSLSVPVGVHTVQAFMDGHTLTDDGYITFNGADINYQKDYSNLTISDSTRVRFVGRVCGGTAQSELPVGFTISRNNIGDDIRLMLEQTHKDKYQIATTLWHDTLTHSTPSIYAMDTLNPKRVAKPVKNTVDYDANYITIHVNDSTGEFYADVLPIDYIVRLTTGNYPKFADDGAQISFMGKSPKMEFKIPRHYTDSMLTRHHIDGKEDTLMWSSAISITDSIPAVTSRVFTVRTSPIVDFYQVDSKGNRVPFYGVDAITTSRNDTVIDLAVFQDSVPDSTAYLMGAPVYDSKYNYGMKAFVCEVYHHYDQANHILWSDSVPTQDAVIHVDNTMATVRQTQISVDSTGHASYTFSLAEPNMATARGTLSMWAGYNDNKNSINWRPEEPIGSGLVIGNHKKGSDFITSGPNHIEFVLRDPPGSGSYSYLEKGHTVTKTRNYTYSAFENGKLGVNITFGYTADWVIGLGYATETSNAMMHTIRAGWAHERKSDFNTTVVTTTTTTERFTTDADELNVGPMSDLFVGAATNYSLAETEMVIVVDSSTYRQGGAAKYNPVFAWTRDSAFVMTKTLGMACNQSFATTFAYTQKDIINQEIPRLKKLLNTILKPYADSAKCVTKANTTGQNQYVLKPGITAESPNYAEEGTYIVICPHINDSTIITSDTILRIKGWIDQWECCLGENEYQKWKSIQTGKNALCNNFSVAAGASLSVSEQYQTCRSASYTRTKKDNFYITHGVEAKNQNIIAFQFSDAFEENAGDISVNTNTATSSYSHTKGFVINPKVDERLSVDVYHEYDWKVDQERESGHSQIKERSKEKDVDAVVASLKALDSYPSFIFSTRGGQTCCPYEPEVDAVYMDKFLHTQLKEDSINKYWTISKSDSTAKKEAWKQHTALHKRHDGLVKEYNEIHGKTVVLSQSTVQVDRPTLEVDKKTQYVDGVPSGETAYVTVYMTNNTDADARRSYYLIQKESSNPNGAALVIDGTGIGTGLTGGSGVSFLIPAKTTIAKTIAVTKGKVLDYDNITLYLVPSCDKWGNKFAIKDSCSFSVHFTPSCSGIDIKSPGSAWVYNNELGMGINPRTNRQEHYLPIELTNFDVNYDEFDHIELQYKPSSDNDNQWIREHYFYKDSASMKASKKDLKQCSVCKNGTIQYAFYMDDKDDQLYDLRAVTFCKNGSSLIENYSDVVSGIKDTYRPRLYGSAKPANGILGIGDEVELTFNENISGGKLTYNNFSVFGILDEAPADHNVSVRMYGNSTLKTEAPLRMQNDFTLEGYFRQDSTRGQQTLIAAGIYPDMVSLVLDRTANHLILHADSLVTTMPADLWVDGVWNHVAIVGRSTTDNKHELSVLVNFKEAKTILHPRDVKIDGRLTVGDKFIGHVDQVRVWSAARSKERLSETSTTRYNNTVVDLVSCYNMDENTGYTLEDVSGGRTMKMDNRCTWAVPEGRALHLDGHSYATLPISQTSLNADKDYTMECWFRLAPNKATNTVLMTTGKVDGNYPDNSFTVGINSYDELYVRSGKNGYAKLSSTLAAQTWYHLVFTVSRTNGFARMYLNGEQVASLTQDVVDGMSGSRLYVGAMMNRYSDARADSASNFFTGEVDEIRLWNYYRPQYQVTSSHMEKPDSIMPGLMFYYPFERYERNQMGIEGLMFSLHNYCKGSSSDTATLYNNAVATATAAPVATTSSITHLDHEGYTFTPSEDGIILTLTKPLARIEHSILTFIAKDIRDANGNKIASPISWTAYIDRNPLVLDEKDITYTTLVNEPVSFDVVLTNRSGLFQTYAIHNTPTWLDCEAESGIIDPNATQTLHFSTSESLPIGTHTAILYIVNSDDVVIPVQITIVVEGDVPDITIDTQKYPYSMSIMGKIQIDGIFSTDTRDILLVFDSSSVCLGAAYTTYYKEFDEYFVYLQVHCDNTRARSLYYVIYDASTGKQYRADSRAYVHSYSNNAVIGSPANPAIFYNSSNQYQTYYLTEGWNWISFNKTPLWGWKTTDVLDKGWTSGDEIKTFDAQNFSDYSTKTASWSGRLTQLDEKNLYMVHVAKDHVLTIVGNPVDPAQVKIPIHQGWNGISYLPSVNLSVKEAMSQFTGVVNNDIIKSQTQFAIYYNGLWVGSLKTMHVGEGYLLRHEGEADSLVYPSTYAYALAPVRRTPVAYETTMSLVATPVGINAKEGDVLTAYCGEEVVGVAELTDNVWYMSIAGDHEDATLNFVYTGMGGQSAATTTLKYRAHRVAGTVETPEPIIFSKEQNAVAVYPSPAQATLYYLLDDAESYCIYSITGERLLMGKAEGGISVGMLPTGVYILELSTKTDTYHISFMKE